jgi:tetratricopeptide (TPR) repeat protein
VTTVRGSRGAAALAALVVSACAGCAPALRAAPPLADLAGGAVPGRDQAPAMLERARALYADRGAPAVRDAASLALGAAAADPSDDAIVLATRALVWLADHEAESVEREHAATRAVQAAQWCGAGRPASAPCSFWLGAALGVQARERPTTGVSALPAIAAAFEAAAAADAAYGRGAPDQALALFYLRAPGWPLGPGDPERGLEHARRAMAIAPEHPPNLLALGEALAANGDPAGARARFEAALARARDAGAAGDPDAPEWIHDAEMALGGDDGS